MGKKLTKWYRQLGKPQSLNDLAAASKSATVSSTEKLYVLQVDFPVSEEIAKGISASLSPLREKYGVDFMVLEPGMRLKRFDDF